MRSPFVNWGNDLNQAIKDFNTLLFKSLNVHKRHLEKLIIELQETIMTELRTLKDAVARNEVSIATVGQQLTVAGGKVANEATEIKEMIDSLKSKINIDTADLVTEVAKLDASTQRLTEFGAAIEAIGTTVSGFVTPDAEQPVPPIEVPEVPPVVIPPDPTLPSVPEVPITPPEPPIA